MHRAILGLLAVYDICTLVIASQAYAISLRLLLMQLTDMLLYGLGYHCSPMPLCFHQAKNYGGREVLWQSCSPLNRFCVLCSPLKRFRVLYFFFRVLRSRLDPLPRSAFATFTRLNFLVLGTFAA